MRQHLEIERWAFWDGSAGGAIALLYALAYPHALNGLIAEMVGPNGRRIAEDPASILNPYHAQYEQDLAVASFECRPAVLAEVAPELAGAYWRPLGTESWVLVQRGHPIIVCRGSEPRERAWAGFEQWMTVLDVDDRLGEIQAPTLIVAGRQDAFMSLAHVAQLPAGIPHAEFVVLEESGHGVEPATADGAQYAAAVRRFLGRLPTMIA